MNRNRVEGTCKQLSGKVQEIWNTLLGDEPGIEAARNIQLLGNIQARCGISQELTERQLGEFRRRHREWNPSSRRPSPAPGTTRRNREKALSPILSTTPHRLHLHLASS